MSGNLMTTRPSIPDVDLARIAPLPEDIQRRHLEQLKKGHPPFSYKPTRQSLLDIMNISPGPLAPATPTSWSQIEHDVLGRCRSDDERKYNKAVALALHTFAQRENLHGQLEEFYPLSIGLTEKLVYWSPAKVIFRGRPHVMFIDPRSSKKLTGDGRRFALSAQHERIRVPDPDFAEFGLCILQFQKLDDGSRQVVPFTDEGVTLYSFDELDEMTQRTYRLWDDVWHGRVEEARRRAAGDKGPLGI